MPTVFRKLLNFIAVFHCRLLLALLASVLLLAGCNSGSSSGDHSGSVVDIGSNNENDSGSNTGDNDGNTDFNGGSNSDIYSCQTTGEVIDVDYSSPVDYVTAFRFLQQATFGPVQADIDEIMDNGIAPWLEAQLAAPSAYDSDSDQHLTHLERLIEVAQALEPNASWFPGDDGYFNGSVSHRTAEYQMGVWFENALEGPDQLRQRVAYALSQILVTSAHEFPLGRNAEALAHYYDILARNALGNFRTLLDEVARSPAMGIYLSHQGNRKANPSANTLPDENFARELMQLFTIGLYKLNLDGTPMLDGQGNLVPTYTQHNIEEMARVMTGWDLQFNSSYGRTDGSFVHFMEFSANENDNGEKQVLGQTIPAGLTDGDDLKAALDILFLHSNTAPFISKQLIQRLVSSNPSPDYIERVASVFIDNGEGVRGDLAAVVRAILMDKEARSVQIAAQPCFGKAREHLLAYTSLYRTFDVQPLNGWVLADDEAGAPVSDIYLFRVHDELGQGPLRAHHVFNFYDPDFVPQDAFYSGSDPQRVMPEMQLRSPNNIASLFDLLRLRKNALEVNELLLDYEQVADFVEEKNPTNTWNNFAAIALLDYTAALNAFELAMDGDSNGDYVSFDMTELDENGETPKLRGLQALLDFLEVRILGSKMLSDGYRQSLIHYLDMADHFNDEGPARDAIDITASAIQYVMLSSTNMALQ